jgi:hypothetical protein
LRVFAGLLRRAPKGEATEVAYGTLFDSDCKIKETILEAQITCEADIDVKRSVITARSHLAYDMAEHVQRLERQIAEYRNG